MPSNLTRRDFVGRAAGLGSILAVSRGIAQEPQRRAGSEARMFVSLNGSLVRGVSGVDKIRLAAKTGYDGVDWDLAPAKAAGLDATRALFAELKIRPTIVGLPMARPLPLGGEPAEFAAALPSLADDAAFVAAVGGRRMMLVLSPAAPRPKAEQRRLVIERLTPVAEVLGKAGIRLGLEFLGPLHFRQGRAGGPPPTPFIWTLPETVALSKEIGPNIGAVLDVWHWHHSGGTVQDILDAGKDRIVHIHLSDAKAMPPEEVRDNQRLMPGEGVIDITGFLRALQQIGYTDGISPEPLGRIPDDMPPEAGAKLGLETTLAAMRKAGIAA